MNRGLGSRCLPAGEEGDGGGRSVVTLTECLFV